MGNIYAGTSGWAYASWKPDFYPAKLAAANFLGYYATRLNSVEVNMTFRRWVTHELLDSRIAATPENFKFAIKANQSITHIKRLHGVAEITRDFFTGLEPLHASKKLGPVLFQLPPYLKCDLARLDEFLTILPRAARSTMEFRHESWFTEGVFERMRGANVALCETESEGLKAPSVGTADFRYLRLRKESYSSGERKAIQKSVESAAQAVDVFVYFKHEDTPQGARYAEGMLKSLAR